MNGFRGEDCRVNLAGFHRLSTSHHRPLNRLMLSHCWRGRLENNLYEFVATMPAAAAAALQCKQCQRRRLIQMIS